MSEEIITLKWGTLKGWDVSPQNERAVQILNRYHELGVSFSVAMQKDSPEQKQLLVELVQLPDMKVFLDWDNKFISQEEAVRYIEDYGEKSIR